MKVGSERSAVAVVAIYAAGEAFESKLLVAKNNEPLRWVAMSQATVYNYRAFPRN